MRLAEKKKGGREEEKKEGKEERRKKSDIYLPEVSQKLGIISVIPGRET